MWLTKKETSLPAAETKPKNTSRQNSVKDDVVVALDGDEVLSQEFSLPDRSFGVTALLQSSPEDLSQNSSLNPQPTLISLNKTTTDRIDLCTSFRLNENNVEMHSADDVEINLTHPAIGDDTLSTATEKASKLPLNSVDSSRRLGLKEYKYRDVVRNRDQRRALKGQSCFRCENVSVLAFLSFIRTFRRLIPLAIVLQSPGL